jgi:nucleoside-diphosphate-sugar epimerase
VLTGSLTEPANESLEPIPQSPYAAAKWAGVAYGRMFRALYGTPVVIMRPFMTYGPGQAPEKLVPSVTAALLKGDPPKLTSGRWKADWVYISDVIEGLLLAATVPGIEGMTFDLGSGTLTSVRRVVDLLVQAVGNEKIKPLFGAIPDRPGEREIAANTAFSASKLGWRATTSLEAGLYQTVEWHRAKGAASTAIAFR